MSGILNKSILDALYRANFGKRKIASTCSKSSDVR